MSNIDPVQALLAFSVLLVSLSVHEAAHAWSADWLGDPTARRLGRVSINPVVHVDLVGTVLFPLVAMFSGLPLIGWAKPVPVNPANLHGDWRRKYMVIAAAGPASNLVLAAAAAAGVRLIGFGESGTIVFRFLFLMVLLNVLLAVFNMVPVPPLDGGNVLTGLLRGPVAAAYDKLRPYGFFILYGLLLTGVLFSIVSPVQSTIMSWLLY